MKTILALLIGLTLLSTGCMFDDMAVEQTLVYRQYYGWGYWHGGGWHPSHPPVVYRPGFGYGHGPYPGPSYRGGGFRRGHR